MASPQYINQYVNIHDTHKLSFIVIGAGLIGPRHASHIKERQDCDLFAIVDHSVKGPEVAERFDTRHFSNLQQLFDYCDTHCIPYPHAAIVATPNHTHLHMGLELASRGIHILMEKPLAPSASDCKTLVAYCKLRQVHLLIGHHRRFNPYIITTRENLHRLGRVVAIQGSWTLCKPPSYFLEKPWRSLVELGGGSLLINLIHDLDLLQYLMGPIEKVYAELMTKQRIDLHAGELVDEGAALTLKFRNGCVGTFICADNVTSPFSFELGTGENPNIPFNDVSGFYRIFGSHGTLSIPDLKLYHQHDYGHDLSDNSMRGNAQDQRSWLKPLQCDQITINYDSIVKQQHENDASSIMEEESGLGTPSPSPEYKNPIMRQEKPQPFQLQLNHFVNLIRGTETEVQCTGEDAALALLCIDAVLASIKTGLPQFVQNLEHVEVNMDLLERYDY